MALVSDILSGKGSKVYTITPEATVYEAVARMNQHKLGALVVIGREDSQEVLGIFTERDVMRRVVGLLRYADLVVVGEVMTRDMVTCSPHLTVDEAAQIMQEQRIRHLPVIDENERLCGMLSIGDINAWHVSRANATITELNDYILGRN